MTEHAQSERTYPLHTQQCGSCGHFVESHRRSPVCRECRCNADPLCQICRTLASKHDDDGRCPR